MREESGLSVPLLDSSHTSLLALNETSSPIMTLDAVSSALKCKPALELLVRLPLTRSKHQHDWHDFARC